MVKCNMSPEEQEKALALFPAGLSAEEYGRSLRYFKRYLFYETWGRKNFREYFCPVCGRFEVEKPYGGYDVYQEDAFYYHHNDYAPCPMCGEKFHLVCLGKAGKLKKLTTWGKLAFVRERDGVLTISAGEAVRRFSFDDLDPWPEYYEKARYVVEPGKRQMWKRVSWFADTSGGEWQPCKSFVEPFPCSYWYGNREIYGEVGIVGVENIQQTSMRYCQVETAFEDGYECCIDDRYDAVPVRGVIRYLGEYSARPQMEMLVKLGHIEVIRELLETGTVDRKLVNWRAKTPYDFFRVSKKEYAYLRKTKNALFALEKYHQDQPENMDLVEYLDTWSALDDETGVFFRECKELGVRPKKAMAWLQTQNADLGDAVLVWRDYLEMAARLERNMTFRRNVMPENLLEEHETACELVAALEEKQKTADEDSRRREYLKKRYKRLRRDYEYTDGTLSIVVPRSEKEIVTEGKRLSHCVGGYARRHMEGKTTILFLREAAAPRRPYVTIEINDISHVIIQAHGYRNEGDGAKPPIIRHEEFFNEWREWLKQGSPRTPKGSPIRPVNKEKEAKTA